jgi:1-acyl-sn-glycerol-3-phosphate acyltransferase
MAVDREHWMTRLFVGAAHLLAGYLDHRILSFERLQRVLRRGRRVVLVGNHALDIVDPLLFVTAVLERHGRVPCFVGHEHGWFRTPVLRTIAARYGVIPSRRMEETSAALARHGFLMLFPGGNREALMRRYREEPYRLKWEGRQGFLRLALEHDADVLFVAAVGNEEMYYQSRLPIPDLLIRLVNAGDATRYHGAPLRFGLLGPHLLPGVFPLPVQLTHVVSPPLDLGDRVRALRDPRAFGRLHAAVWARCQAFLDAAVAGREHRAGTVDRLVRAGERRLVQLGL